jgi:hypothetical protein
MLYKTIRIAVMASLLVHSYAALSVPFGSYDARSLAMGGAGVAVGNAGTAPLFNPALLSVPDGNNNFALVLPAVGLRVADPDNLRDSIESFQSSNVVNNLTTSVTDLNAAITTATTGTPTSADIAAIALPASQSATNLTNLSNQLSTLGNKPLTVDGGVSTVIALPHERLGLAFYASASVVTGGLFIYNDAPTVQTISNQLNCLASAAALPTTTNPEIAAAVTAINACGTNVDFTNTTLQSGINFRGVALAEAGLAISTFNLGYLTWGVTPKIVKARLFDIPINVNDSNQTNTESKDYEANYTMTNFDIGIATSDIIGWRTGLVVKNVIPYSLDYKRALIPGTTPVRTGQTLELKPLVRVGLSHTTSWSTVALDIDVTRNDPVGYEKQSQYVALGGELNAWDVLAIRAGYRADLVNPDRSVASLGVGLGIFGIPHVDVAVAGNASEVGASLQFGVRF